MTLWHSRWRSRYNSLPNTAYTHLRTFQTSRAPKSDWRFKNWINQSRFRSSKLISQSFLYTRTSMSHFTCFDHPEAYIILVVSVCLVCLYVCLYVCQTITFESLDVRSSYLHMQYISTDYGSSSYMKVIGSSSRSQEPKKSKIPKVTHPLLKRRFPVYIRS